MSRDADAVYEAIDRWTETLLIDEDTAAALRRETAKHAASGTKRLSQYLLATAAGAVLLIAGGIFIDWAWPNLDVPARAGLLALAGVAVLTLGVRLERGHRWLPASFLMQASGLGLLLSAYAYSGEAWLDLTPAGIAVGVLALATPIVLAPRAMRANVVMPAVHLAASFAFLAIFLDRATTLSDDEIVWVLDGVLVVAMVTLVTLLKRDPEGARHPWALNAFVMSMAGGFVLIFWTGVEVLGLSDDVIYPMDVWLLLTAGLTLWGIHRAPAGLRREWFGVLLAWLVIAWIPFGLISAYELFGSIDAEVAVIAVSGVAAVAFVHGNRFAMRPTMWAATFAFIVGLWVWAVDRGGALGGVAALVATAGLLFWVSGRTGDPDDAARDTAG